MKIGIDARICSEGSYYAKFISELIEAFIAENTEHTIIVYSQKKLPYNRRSFFQNLKAKRIFEKEKFALMIFFDQYIPHGYTGNYIILLENLKEVFFPKKKWIHRKIHSHGLKKALQYCKKVCVMDTGSAMELNENLNIHEDKIRTFPGFFPSYEIMIDSPLKIDVKIKHNLKSDYLIYDSGNEIHNNFERILKALKTLKESGISLYLFVLCEATTRDIDIRNKVLEYGMSDQMIFLGNIAKAEEIYYYSQSVGVIFSSIYESFPFQFTKALAYNCQIFANNIPANTSTMGSSIHYLDPLSIHNMCDVLSESISHPHTPKYMDLDFFPQKSAQRLWNVVEEKN